jgi:hypothetical protein
MSINSHEEATTIIAGLLHSIQVLHAEARAISDEFEIPFDITLEGGQNYDTTATYSGWQSSSYNC